MSASYKNGRYRCTFKRAVFSKVLSSKTSSTHSADEPIHTMTFSAFLLPTYSSGAYFLPTTRAKSLKIPVNISATFSYEDALFSLFWKNTSGFCEEPFWYGALLVIALCLNLLISSVGKSALISSSVMMFIFCISCDVRNPSKKWTTGKEVLRARMCAMSAKSCASCTEFEHKSIAPVCRTAITSLWSPNMERAWVATVRAAI